MGAFNKQQTDGLKGLFAIGVIIHHICLGSGIGNNYGLGPIYNALGYCGVSVFLFISGYGLMNRYLQIRGGYFRTYIRNRILPIYMLNAILVFLYYVVKHTIGKSLTPILILQSFTFGNTIVEYGWYLQVCMLFYIFFMLSFKYTSTIHTGIIVMSTFIIVYAILSYLCGLPSTWFECSFAIIAGIAIRLKQDSIVAFSKTTKISLLCFIVSLFSLSYVLGNGQFIQSDMWIFWKMVSSIAFGIMIFMLTHWINLKGKLLKWLGGHYLELYVLQGISLIFADKYIGYDAPIVYFTSIVVVTIILAAIFKRPIVLYMELFKTKKRG